MDSYELFKKDFKILDTHLGSMSIAMAVDEVNKIEKLNLHLTGCEIDLVYFQDGIKRLKNQEIKLTIF